MLKISKISVLVIFLISFHFSYAQDSIVFTKEGHIEKNEIFNLIYIPIEIPKGINSISVQQIYNEGEGANKNVLNMGIYDPRGYEVGNPKGFRGWSGGAKTSFFVTNMDASTGYIAGPIYSGVWQVLIYPSDISDAGIDWRLEIKATKGKETNLFKVNPANNAINEIPGWYHGDLHMHTLHSDGKRTTQELVEEAHARKLDFIISTEHNTNSANLAWGKYDSKDLLILNGEEVTSTEFGHWNAIGLKHDTYIDWRYPPQELWINQMVDQVHQDDGLAIINHPFFDKQLINTFKYDFRLFDGVEVWNGNWNILNNLAVAWWNDQLIAGHKLIAIGASDTHISEGSRSNLGTPQTVVYAQSLSATDLLKGMKQGSVYIRANDSIEISFEVYAGDEKAMLGDTLRIGSDENSYDVHLQVKICKDQKLIIYSNLGIFKETILSSDDEDLAFEINNTEIKFLRVEVRTEEDAMLALTNPIFISYQNKPSGN
jgi:hypothetical protein